MASIPLAMLTLPWSTICARIEQPASDTNASSIMQSEETKEGDCKSIAARAQSVVDEELHGMMVRAAEKQNRVLAYNYIFPVDSLPEGRRWDKPESLPKNAIGVWAWPFEVPEDGVPMVWAYMMPEPDNKRIIVGALNSAGDFRIFYQVRQIDGSKYSVDGEDGQSYYTILRTRKGRWTVTDGEKECSQCKRGFTTMPSQKKIYSEGKEYDLTDEYIKDTYFCLRSNTPGEMPDEAFRRYDETTGPNERAHFGKRKFWNVNMQWMSMSNGVSSEDADPSPYIALDLARMLCKEHAPKGVFNIIGDVCQ